MASERALFVRPDTSFDQGSGCSKSPPTDAVPGARASAPGEAVSASMASDESSPSTPPSGDLRVSAPAAPSAGPEPPVDDASLPHAAHVSTATTPPRATRTALFIVTE